MVIINSITPPKGNISKRNQRKERQSRTFLLHAGRFLLHWSADRETSRLYQILYFSLMEGGVNVYYVENHTIENNDQLKFPLLIAGLHL